MSLLGNKVTVLQANHNKPFTITGCVIILVSNYDEALIFFIDLVAMLASVRLFSSTERVSIE